MAERNKGDSMTQFVKTRFLYCTMCFNITEAKDISIVIHSQERKIKNDIERSDSEMGGHALCMM